MTGMRFNGSHLISLSTRIVLSSLFLCSHCSIALSAQGQNPAPAIPSSDKDYQMPASGELSVHAENGLTFEARINGKGPFTALLDTGAGVNILSAKLAEQLGLNLDSKAAELGTSSPATVKVHKTQVGTLQIGDLLLRNQTFYVIDFPGGVDDSSIVVGYELLRRFAIKIDHENQRVTFYDGPGFHYAGPGTAVPLRIEENAVLVPGVIGKASAWFQLDSGNDSGTMMFTRFTVKNNLIQSLGARYLAYNGRGFAGPSPEAYLARVASMRLGDVRLPSIIARFSTDPSDERSIGGNIGEDILNRFTEVFDCMHGRVYFETTKASDAPEVFNRAGLIFDSFGRGLQVMTVLPGSPGAQAGVEVGDLITTIDGKTPSDEMNQPAFLQPVGTRLRLTVQHGTKTREVSVTLRDVL